MPDKPNLDNLIGPKITIKQPDNTQGGHRFDPQTPTTAYLPHDELPPQTEGQFHPPVSSQTKEPPNLINDTSGSVGTLERPKSQSSQPPSMYISQAFEAQLKQPTQQEREEMEAQELRPLDLPSNSLQQKDIPPASKQPESSTDTREDVGPAAKWLHDHLHPHKDEE